MGPYYKWPAIAGYLPSTAGPATLGVQQNLALSNLAFRVLVVGRNYLALGEELLQVRPKPGLDRNLNSEAWT